MADIEEGRANATLAEEILSAVGSIGPGNKIVCDALRVIAAKIEARRQRVAAAEVTLSEILASPPLTDHRRDSLHAVAATLRSADDEA